VKVCADAAPANPNVMSIDKIMATVFSFVMAWTSSCKW
jgi:hypothetical protein